MPLSLTRRPGDRIRFRVGIAEAWLTVIEFDGRETRMELTQAGTSIPLLRSPATPVMFKLANKNVEVRVGERIGNQVRISIAGDDVEVLREELLLAGRKASA